MRIGLVIEHFDPARGGAEQWTWQFARWLVQQGHELHVVARDFAPAAHQIPLVAHGVPSAVGRLEFAQAAERQVRSLGLDVVHDMGSGWACDVFQPHGGSRHAAFEQNLLLLPSWLRPLKRHVAPRLPRYRAFDELVARQWTGQGRLFVALSQMVTEHFVTYHGADRRQIRTIYNGVDIGRFVPANPSDPRRAMLRHQWGVADDELLLLIVAHNFRLKGVATLLATVGELRRRGQPVRLVVVGGRPSARWRHLAERAGAAKFTRFVGPIDDPTPHYAAADVYVHPTFYDPCSLVVLEALASALPVVTSRYNGAGELLTPGVEGYVIDDPANAQELAAALQPLMDPQRRRAMSQAARRLAERHTLEHNFRQIEQVYLEVRSRRRAA